MDTNERCLYCRSEITQDQYKETGLCDFCLTYENDDSRSPMLLFVFLLVASPFVLLSMGFYFLY